MGKPIIEPTTITRFCRSYAFHHNGNATRKVVIAVTEPGELPWEIAARKAEQLQALLTVMEDGWNSVTEIHESLGMALCRLAHETAGDIVGLSELAQAIGQLKPEKAREES